MQPQRSNILIIRTDSHCMRNRYFCLQSSYKSSLSNKPLTYFPIKQVILLMALARGKSMVTCGQPTLHTQTAIHMAETMTRVSLIFIYGMWAHVFVSVNTEIQFNTHTWRTSNN